MKKTTLAAALVLLALGAAVPAPAPAQQDDPVRRLKRFAEGYVPRLEVKPLERAPAWALEERTPLWTFVQLADIHWTPRTERFFADALAYVNERLRPDLVVLTGDNISPPITVERHRALRERLEAGLACPVVIGQGDNDTRHFAEVFGSPDFSFDFGGVHFAFVALDTDTEGDGIGTIRGETLDWLAADLDAARARPALLLRHEPIAPPTFLSAAPLLGTLLARDNVAAAIAGHLHYDLEVRTGPILHISAPAIGPNARHGIKEYRVFEDRVVVRTHERDDATGYAPAPKWQRIDFPEGLRVRPPAEGARPALTGFARREGKETRFSESLRVARDLGLDGARSVLRRLEALRDRLGGGGD